MVSPSPTPLLRSRPWIVELIELLEDFFLLLPAGNPFPVIFDGEGHGPLRRRGVEFYGHCDAALLRIFQGISSRLRAIRAMASGSPMFAPIRCSLSAPGLVRGPRVGIRRTRRRSPCPAKRSGARGCSDLRRVATGPGARAAGCRVSARSDRCWSPPRARLREAGFAASTAV